LWRREEERGARRVDWWVAFGAPTLETLRRCCSSVVVWNGMGGPFSYQALCPFFLLRMGRVRAMYVCIFFLATLCDLASYLGHQEVVRKSPLCISR